MANGRNSSPIGAVEELVKVTTDIFFPFILRLEDSIADIRLNLF